MTTALGTSIYICSKCGSSLVVGKDSKNVKCVDCDFEGEARIYDFRTKKTYAQDGYSVRTAMQGGGYGWSNTRKRQYI